MKWIILIAIGIFLIWKMSNTTKINNASEVIINGLKKHSPEELAEIVQWEHQLRSEVLEIKILNDSGKIPDDEFIAIIKILLEEHKEIEQKYNVTEEEMTNYYLASQKIHSSKVFYR